MDRLLTGSTSPDHQTSSLLLPEKPRLNRETLRALDLGPAANAAPRAPLTAKCVTFNAGAIRATNAA